MRITNLLSLTQQLKRRPNSYRDLIREEAKIGGKLFGPVPANRRREFFCLDERTWVWHEEWIDQVGAQHSKTTRFEIHSDRILKIQNGQYFKVDTDEALNLYQAAQLYYQRVRSQIYHQVA